MTIHPVFLLLKSCLLLSWNIALSGLYCTASFRGGTQLTTSTCHSTNQINLEGPWSLGEWYILPHSLGVYVALTFDTGNIYIRLHLCTFIKVKPHLHLWDLRWIVITNSFLKSHPSYVNIHPRIFYTPNRPDMTPHISTNPPREDWVIIRHSKCWCMIEQKANTLIGYTSLLIISNGLSFKLKGLDSLWS